MVRIKTTPRKNAASVQYLRSRRRRRTTQVSASSSSTSTSPPRVKTSPFGKRPEVVGTETFTKVTKKGYCINGVAYYFVHWSSGSKTWEPAYHFNKDLLAKIEEGDLEEGYEIEFPVNEDN